jgi:hypothetical protein
MHSLLSLLFSFVIAVLVYGFSFFPSADLARAEDPDELAGLIDQESANSAIEGTQSLASGRHPGRAG